jgi:hypothetical protein
MYTFKLSDTFKLSVPVSNLFILSLNFILLFYCICILHNNNYTADIEIPHGTHYRNNK